MAKHNQLTATLINEITNIGIIQSLIAIENGKHVQNTHVP
jgi:hypothetical protein